MIEGLKNLFASLNQIEVPYKLMLHTQAVRAELNREVPSANPINELLF